jgi:hypothetical protein
VQPLTIRIRKGRDGPHSLVCVRADGSMTMQKHPTQFFPLHDLIHYAVETTLGHRRGFYGLVAEGWDLSDFGTPWPRGRLPQDVDPSELIVGAFGLEQGTGHPTSAEEINSTIAAWYAEHDPNQAGPTVTEDQVSRVRDEIKRLHATWRALGPGQTLELRFPPEY